MSSQLDSNRLTVVLLVDDQPMVAEAIRRMLVDQKDVHFHYCQQADQAVELAMEIATCWPAVASNEYMSTS